MHAALWATTWGLGVALGVALGGWLTVVGGVGMPGVASLDITEDLIILPLLAGGVVFVVHFLGQAVVSVLRRRRTAYEEYREDEQRERTVDDGVDG